VAVVLAAGTHNAIIPSFNSTFSSAGRPSFSLIGNPLSCDCATGWLKGAGVADSTAATRSAFVSDLDKLTCSIPTRPDQLPAPLLSVADEDFLCPYETHCSARCVCCDFYACDCRFQCPDGCSCFRDTRWSRNVVQCSASARRSVPLLLPQDASEIRLDGNNLGHLRTQSFLGRSNVERLFLNGSNILSLGNGTLSGLSGLESLHLQDNNIGELRGYEFAGLANLKELYLHNNDLVYINEVSFDPLPSLRALTLDGNLLTVFPVWHLLGNSALELLTLSRNTWSCECEFLRPFGYFLEAKAAVISDYDRVQCLSDNALDEGVLGGQGVSICGPQGEGNQVPLFRKRKELDEAYPQQDRGNNFMPIFVPSIAVSVVLISVFLAVFVFRRPIKDWMYKSGGKEVYGAPKGPNSAVPSSAASSTYCTTSASASKLFDVYVSYSARDAEFVDQTLAPTLENGGAGGAPSYKLCLHHRDCPQSASPGDAAAVAVESSSRVLIILSRGYLETEWPTVSEAVRAAVAPGDGGGKVVILLAEDVGSNVDADMTALLRACPTVRWGSHGFLSKLRFFLPEPAFLTFQRSVTLRHQQRQLLQRPPMPAPQAHYSAYAARSDHTYHSIPDNHIYHTLEPNPLSTLRHKPPNAPVGLAPGVLLGRDLELILRGQASHPAPVIQQQQMQQPQIAVPALSAATPISAATPSPLMFSHHSHTHSASSGAQLLPPSTVRTPQSSSVASPRRPEEYVV